MRSVDGKLYNDWRPPVLSRDGRADGSDRRVSVAGRREAARGDLGLRLDMIEYATLFLGALSIGVVTAPLAPSSTSEQLKGTG